MQRYILKVLANVLLGRFVQRHRYWNVSVIFEPRLQMGPTRNHDDDDELRAT
ncbi:hypothetical protein X777_16625 [Ooceraea biroi]|uniref:Uncharacterized protein n=1 Tax=Ooceraea biroi TaxID=2015173 RepID=A0A026VU45_OOCBI|nr:hypothetical protein X777_16625 [Ooceraea biroi]